MTWPLPPRSTRPPQAGYRLAMKFADGRVYNFDSVGGRDLGAFNADGGPRQRNIRATIAGVPAAVYFRPDVVADASAPEPARPRDEFVFIIDEADGEPFTVILYRDGRVLGSKAIWGDCRHWRWESWARPTKAS